MRKIALVFVLPMLLAQFSACSRPLNVAPVVVHLFRDPSSSEVTRAILTVGEAGLVTLDNRPIVIATEEPRTYREGLTMLGEQSHPDVVILDSVDDSRKIDPTSLSAVRTENGQYFIGIPKWSDREKKNAVERVMAELRRALEKQSRN